MLSEVVVWDKGGAQPRWSSYEVINKECAFYCALTHHHPRQQILSRYWPASHCPRRAFDPLRWWLFSLTRWTLKAWSDWVNLVLVFTLRFFWCLLLVRWHRETRRKMDLSALENNIHFQFINLIPNSITHLTLLRKSSRLLRLFLSPSSSDRHLNVFEFPLLFFNNKRKFSRIDIETGNFSFLSQHITHLPPWIDGGDGRNIDRRCNESSMKSHDWLNFQVCFFPLCSPAFSLLQKFGTWYWIQVNVSMLFPWTFRKFQLSRTLHNILW